LAQQKKRMVIENTAKLIAGIPEGQERTTDLKMGGLVIFSHPQMGAACWLYYSRLLALDRSKS
jgi:hypothetical protein